MTGNDWYAVLGLAASASTEEITAAVEKRSRQASAMANTAPERSQQLREQLRALKRDLLSGDDARERYDAARRAAGAGAPGTPPALPHPDGALAQQATIPGAEPQPGYHQGYGQPSVEQQHGQSTYPQPVGEQQLQGRRPGRFRAFLQSGWTCPTCAESYTPGDKFCTQCNQQLTADRSYVPVPPPTNPNACYYCGTIAATTHRFCRNCGAGRP
jgi:hypothetical protein